MLELANLGAGVLHPRAVEFAKNHNVVLEVRSSMEQENGTIVKENVTWNNNQSLKVLHLRIILHVSQLRTRTRLAFNSFSTLAAAHINVDIIIQSITNEGTVHLSFHPF